MPNFDYVALQESGREVTGVEEGASEQEVLQVLASRELYLLNGSSVAFRNVK